MESAENKREAGLHKLAQAGDIPSLLLQFGVRYYVSSFQQI
jgi:hypothetical protein